MEKLDKATGRWVPVGKTTEPEMDVKGLQEGHEYQFRVKAINDEGESEPLETDASIVAKNPYGTAYNNSGTSQNTTNKIFTILQIYLANPELQRLLIGPQIVLI